MKRLYRQLLCGSFTLLFGLGCLPFSFLFIPALLLFPKALRREIVIQSVHLTWYVFTKSMIAGRAFKADLNRLLPLHDLRGAIVIANHPTFLDIMLLITAMPRATSIVKGSLGRNFFIRKVVEAGFIVNTGDPQAQLDQVSGFLKAGFNLIVFPEGTRTRFKEPYEPKLSRGFAHIALETGAPVIPVRIACDPVFLGKERRWHDAQTTTPRYSFSVLPPLRFTAFPGENRHRQAVRLTADAKQSLFPK